MTKEELRKEFDDLCDIDKQHPKKIGTGAYVFDDYKFDWFYSKLKESDDAGSKLSSQGIDLEMLIKSKDEKIKGMHEQIDAAVRLYSQYRTEYGKLDIQLLTLQDQADELEAKLKEKDLELAKHTSFIDKCSNEMGIMETRLKAADEVIRTTMIYINSISGRDIVIDKDAFQDSEDALEHYKSLKP